MKKNVVISVLTLSLGAIIMASAAGCRMAETTEPQAPSGGKNYILDYGVFVTQIDSILTDRGCDTMACHGGGIRGTFQLSPDTDKDIDLDFAQVSLQVNPENPAASPLLTKPLAESAGGVIHTADPARSGFLSTSDPGYRAILAWIEAGEYR